MRANWGYQDGSGDYFISIDTDKCDGCGACVEACPQNVLEIGEDPIDPMRDEPVAFIAEGQRNKIKFACSPCKTYLTSNNDLSPELLVKEMQKFPCVSACSGKDAISHSW